MTGSNGQDWASYQASTPATTGLDFAFVKATEATGYVNPRHSAQVAAARAGGLVVGHYHFQRPGPVAAQAAFFVAHATPRPGDLLACDWEDPDVPDEAKDAFIRAVKTLQPGLRVLLYCNRDFWLNRDHTGYAGDGLWIADPSAPKGQPRITSPWVIHQYSDAGGLDRDWTPLAPAALRAFAAGTTPTPTVQEDDVTPEEFWSYPIKSGVSGDPHAAAVYVGWLDRRAADEKARDDAQNKAIANLGAQLGVLTAIVTKGINVTVADIQTAAKQGAADALTDAVVNVHVDVNGQPTA